MLPSLGLRVTFLFHVWVLLSSGPSAGNAERIKEQTDDFDTWSIPACGSELTDYSGSVSLLPEGGCTSYANCEWRIVAQGNPEAPDYKGIFVAFSTFDLHWIDCVHVFPVDGNFTGSIDSVTSVPNYSSYCGFQTTGTSFFSYSDQMVIAFKTCSARNYPGFKLLYTSDFACSTSRRLPSNIGTFTTPFYPQTFTRDLLCSWYIYVPSGTVLVLDFVLFEIGGTDIDECSTMFGYLNISGSQSGVLNYCNGNKPPKTLQLRGINRDVYFHFYSGDFIPSEGNGFQISYQIVPENSVTWPSTTALLRNPSDSKNEYQQPRLTKFSYSKTQVPQSWSSLAQDSNNLLESTSLYLSCRDNNGTPVLLSNYSGLVESPNFPNNHPTSADCQWRILPHSDEGIFVVFTFFNLHWSDCVHMAPYSVQGPTKTDYFCGSYNQTLSTYIKPDVLIHFRPCSGFSYPGFRMLYTSDNACYGGGSGRLLSRGGGTFSSPFFPNSYLQDLSCRWHITIPSGQMMVLTFDLFNLDGPSSGSCGSSHASVHVTASNTGSKVFCSSQPPTQKLYLTGTVTVVFDSGDINPLDGKGFRASYKLDRENVIMCGTGIRLVGGAFSYVGRLEILYNGRWGTVCANGFDSTAANVACYNLGFAYAGALVNNIYGPGDGPIWLANVECAGSETCLGRCKHDDWGTNTQCNHNSDVAITCQLSRCNSQGDPHYTSFDNWRFDYMGLCKYLLVAPQLPEQLSNFRVTAKNYACGSTVSCTDYVEVEYDGDIFRSSRTLNTVNGVAIQLPYTSRNTSYTVRMAGSYVKYEANFGMRVERASWDLNIYVPGSSEKRMTGLCGNNDGNLDNDKTLANGTYVGDRNNAAKLVGDSFIIYDSEDPNAVCQTPDPPPPCAQPPPSHAQGCGHLTDTNGIFAQCIARIGNVDALENYNSCMMDACYTSGKSICESLQRFVVECADYDIVLDCDYWRMATGCDVNQVQCPSGMLYRCNTTACQATCSDPDAPEDCNLPNSEGCVCPDGQTLHNGKCVTSCPVGCVDDNQQFHPIGDQWPGLFNCTTLTCVFCADCPLNGRIESQEGCQDNEICINNMCTRPTTTTVRPTTTTTTMPTTTGPPEPSMGIKPYISVSYNGSFYAIDVISFDCQDSFNQEIRSNFQYVVSRANNLIAGGALCVPGLLVQAGQIQISTNGALGRVTYTLNVGVNVADHITVNQTKSCTWQVGSFTQDFRNWRQPLIPALFGCPITLFSPETFDFKQVKWNC